MQRLAESAGAAVTGRYRHEQMPFAGLDAADAALNLQQALADLPGMLRTGRWITAKRQRIFAVPALP